MSTAINPFSDVPVPAVPEPAPVEPSAVLPPRRGRGDRDLIDGEVEYRRVPINDLHPDPDQPRKTMRNVGELAKNIAQVGLGQPITARIDAHGNLTIMYGERRWRALQQLGWEYAPTMIRYGVKDSDVLAQQLAENSMREDLDPIEEARGVRAFMRREKISTYLQAAEALGHSLTWVTNRVALLDLDEADQVAVSKKEISILAGAQMSRQKTGKTRFSAKREAATGNGGGRGYSTNRYASSPVTVRREPPHFSDEHPLAGRARARCKVHDFPKPLIGGVACGVCWEIVIRLDEGRNPLPISGRTPIEGGND